MPPPIPSDSGIRSVCVTTGRDYSINKNRKIRFIPDLLMNKRVGNAQVNRTQKLFW